MRKSVTSIILASMIAVLGFGFLAVNTYAEEGDNNTESSETAETPKTSLTLMPVSRTLQISSNSTYDGTLTVTNDGSEEMKVEAYAAPYSYVYSEEDGTYNLGFNNQNNFTQLSRWITIKNKDEEYVERPSFKIPAGESLNIDYKITTPSNIPAGGQYAVIFVQTVSGNINANGIHTEASAGMVVYGHSTEGETIIASEISGMEIGQGTKTGGTMLESGEIQVTNNNFYGSAKVKNTGNVDFFARGKLKVEPIIGFSSYETPENGNLPSIIPESERVVSDEWTETPDFGIYKVTWTVTAGENTETIERVFFLINPIVVILTIIVLTIIVVSIIIGVRKRKARRSRLAV